MKLFKVHVSVLADAFIEVEAKDLEDAKDQARIECTSADVEPDTIEIDQIHDVIEMSDND